MGSAVNDSLNADIKNEMNSDKTIDEDVIDLEWSADQEILLLYSLHGCKPVGPNKHFRMLLIQDRLSSALNKNIPSKLIWKKLNMLYDLEALDEAEAEADAAVALETEFYLPEDEFGELMAKKLRERNVEEVETENSDSQGGETLMDIKLELEEGEDEEEMEKEVKKEIKRGPKKKDVAVSKDITPAKKDNKETLKKETSTKKDIGKESKKGVVKENEKKNAQEMKKETAREQKEAAKPNKRESIPKVVEQTQKEAIVKKGDQKKSVETPKNQRETTRPRAETPKLRLEKKMDTKVTRTETPKPQRVEALKKDLSVEKKKDTPDKKAERKSPEKTLETTRSAKLRARDKKETESDKADTPAGSKRERSRDSTSKASDASSEEPPTKKVKTPATKGRPTRNSLEQSTPTASSPQKRRTRLL